MTEENTQTERDLSHGGVALSSNGGFGSDSSKRWRRIRAIFDEVQAAPSDQRTSLLEQLCDGDADLQTELESLLEASDGEEALSEDYSDPRAPEGTSQPRKVGPYEIDRLLGRGGMGAVYLAHRADGEFNQQVAIKLIDVPIASDLFRRQFRTERQILAGLSHPFIAHLLDGGVSMHGELYLALEYVDGIPILQYCQQNRLPLHARLRLFKDVCCAVMYAHQNLIIHRDLKPDNILVVADGTPRLLDFGTAKLLAPLPGESASELTMQGLRSFTPQYASPEQVLGKSISTAADIYSLGVILFQLLADRPPYFLREFNTEEMLRVICEEQPPRPSKVAIGADKPDADLDCIALMALRKEPSERYLTVDQFAADLQAWLDGRPVIARRGTLRYRVGKFAKRNKVWFGVAALLAAILVCGIAGIFWQARAATLQRIRAEESAQELRELSKAFLSEIDAAVRELPGSTPVRHLMVQRVLQRLDRMAANSGGDRLTQMYLADAYIHLGNLQGNRYGPNIGDSRGALESLNKAVSLSDSLKSAQPDDGTIRDLWISARKSRSQIQFGIGKSEEAVSSIRPIIEFFDSEAKNSSVSAAMLSNAANTYDLLGDVLGEPGAPSLGDYSGALDAYHKAGELFDHSLMKDPGSLYARKELALNALKVGSVLMLTDPHTAISTIQESLARWDSIPWEYKSGHEDKRTILYDTIKLGDAYTRARDYSRALQAYQRAVQEVERDLSLDPKDTRAQEDLAGILGSEADPYVDMLDPILYPQGHADRQANTRKAIMLLRRASALNESLVSEDPNNSEWTAYLAHEKTILGTLLQLSGDRVEGIRLVQSGLESLRTLASRSEATEDTLYRATLAFLKAPVELSDSQLTLQLGDRLAVVTHRKDPNSLLLLAQAYRADRQFEKARATANEGLSLLPPQYPDVPSSRCRIFLEHIISSN